MKKSLQVLAAAAAMTLSLAANAASVTKSTVTVIDVANHASTLSLAGFDTSLGTLTSVQFTVYSSVSGLLQAENKGSKVSDIGLGTGGDLTLTIPGEAPIKVSSVYSQSWTNVARWDRTTDYAGASGRTESFTDKLIAPVSTAVLNDQASLALYGSGSAFTVGLTGKAVANSSGNVSYYTESSVSARATVTYTYTPASPVPEPESYAMLLAGLGMMGVVLRKRKANKAA
jgi:hypothetical protein